MIKIDLNQQIEIQRGDFAEFYITFTKNPPEDGMEILFTVKRTAMENRVWIEKRYIVQGGRILVQLTNSDTKGMAFGRYEWDIRIPNLYGEKEPYTPMNPKPFVVAKVVGNV